VDYGDSGWGEGGGLKSKGLRQEVHRAGIKGIQGGLREKGRDRGRISRNT
jgi:hypothetical protein